MKELLIFSEDTKQIEQLRNSPVFLKHSKRVIQILQGPNFSVTMMKILIK